MNVLRIVALLFLAATAFAQQPAEPPTREQALALIRAWTDAQRQYDEIPAMSVAIVHDQTVIWSGGFGEADPAAGRKATADTLYSICSVSKLFTSIGVMKLRDEGRLRLDDPVRQHLEWFKLKPAEGGGEVTVRGILTHSAGLPREADFPYWTGDFKFPTHEEVVERIGSQEALYPPDTYFQYSNLGLTLAGELIADASGQPYERFVRQQVLEPLGMRDTFTEMPDGERGKRLAQGFSARRRNGSRTPLPFFTTRGIAPAAGYASTVNDLARFASWQFRLLKNGGKEVLDARTLREMQRPQWVDPDLDLFWGLGFATWKTDGSVLVGHGGSCPGFRTAFMTEPAKKLAVIVMANASGVEANRYAGVIRQIIAPTLKEPPKKTPAADLARYTGSYDAYPWSGETIVFAWGDHLGAVELPTMEPLKEMDLLRKVGENTFRRVRKDEALGEPVVFETGPDGLPVRLRWHHNPFPRIGAPD